MRDITPHTIELIAGYTDKKEVTHRRVTFGRIVTGRQLFNIASDPQSSSATQSLSLLLRAAITEFGSLKIPVTLNTLLELDSIDRDDLTAAFNAFAARNMGDGQAVILSPEEVKLGVGYEHNGVVYDLVKFGRRLTGMDDVLADRLRLKDLRKTCFLAGRQVVKLAQSEGQSELEGAITLEMFEQMLVGDVEAIKEAAEIYRQSFRFLGAGVSQVADGENHIPAGEGDGVE